MDLVLYMSLGCEQFGELLMGIEIIGRVKKVKVTLLRIVVCY